MEHPCSEPFTSAAVTASADGAHKAGALRLTLKSEPAGTARYSITPRTAGGFKLTVNNCVREIGINEFNANSTIIRGKATAEGVSRFSLLTEIDLPSTLRQIGRNSLSLHISMSETLNIPRNVETIGNQAFNGNAGSSPYTVAFETGSKLKSIGDGGFRLNKLKDFRLPENLETIALSAFYDAIFSFSPGFSPAGTLIIPAKAAKIGGSAFAQGSSGGIGITTVDIRSRQLAKPAGALAADFPLQPNLFQNVTGITSITLPAEVHNSYTPAERSAIFGSITLNPVP